MWILVSVVGAVAQEFPRREQGMYFAHIPKTGGLSFLIEVKNMLQREARNRTFLTAEELLSQSQWAGRNVFVMTQLRIPRLNVASQYMHCRDAPNKMRKVKERQSGTEFPQGDSVVDGLGEWIAYDFDVDGDLHFEDHFGCYNPRDLQAHFLAGPGDDKEARALLELRRTHFVSVLELVAEMLCVMSYGLFGDVSDACACENATSLTHKSHQVAHIDVAHLPPALVSRIDDLTRSDVPVYLVALGRALQAIRDVEAKTGKTLLCPQAHADLLDSLHASIPHFADRLSSPLFAKLRKGLGQRR